MAKDDVAVKRLLSDKKRFADLFNVRVFGGKQVLHPNNLTPVESESSILILDKEGRKRAVQRYRDIVMRASFGVDFMILACENQAKIHYAMPMCRRISVTLSQKRQVGTNRNTHFVLW